MRHHQRIDFFAFICDVNFANMKKIILLIVAASLLMACSSDSGSAGSDVLLIRKIVSESESPFGGSDVHTVVYTYNGQKLIKYTRDNSAQYYYYNGDRIIRLEYRANGTATSQTNFLYDGLGRLIEANVTATSGQTFISTYEYNADNTVSETDHFSLPDGGQATSTSKFFMDENNEVIRKEDYYNAGTEVTAYTYDNKNNPFKNIIGIDKLKLLFVGSKFNVLMTSHTDAQGNVVSTRTTDFTYNASDFPETSVSHSSEENTADLTEHFYY